MSRDSRSRVSDLQKKPEKNRKNGACEVYKAVLP